MKALPATLTALVALLPATVAFAQPARSQPAPVPDQEIEHSASITVSPVHLAIGMVELTSEFRVGDHLGISATLGAGQLQGITIAEAGAQLAYYMTGNFDGGLHLGAELQFLTAVNDADADAQAQASAEGLALGPMIGWKWIGASGFSFVAQAGFQYMAVQARAESGGATAMAENSRFGPLLNLNTGWSF